MTHNITAYFHKYYWLCHLATFFRIYKLLFKRWPSDKANHTCEICCNIVCHSRSYKYFDVHVVWKNFTVGIFHVKNFMLKYFHLLGYKYVHLLAVYLKVKIFHVLNFHPRRLQMKIL